MTAQKEKKENTVQIAERLAKPFAEQRGIELWDVRFEKEGSQWYLRYFIDKEDGVSIGDCEFLSRAVEKLLDETDPIEQSYILEVSSPGIERELVKDWHFERYTGFDVNVRLIRAVDGEKNFIGELLPKVGDKIAILLDGDAPMSFSKAEVSSVRLAADYKDGGLD